jgi:hypothetical protein
MTLVILSAAKDLHFQCIPYSNQASSFAANFRFTALERDIYSAEAVSKKSTS